MRQSTWAVLSLLALWGSGAGPADAVDLDNPAKIPDAAIILDRYVQVTGGRERYHTYVFKSVYSTVTGEDKTSFNTALFHARDGATEMEVDARAESQESGVSNGIVWEFSESKGARILSGKAAERKLAESRGFDEDDWREIEQYENSLGIVHPSLLHVKAGQRAYTIRVDSLTYSPLSARRLEIPHEVARAAAAKRSGGSLPNPVDLIDRFIEATGGKQAYLAIKTEMVKANISVKAQNLEFPLVMYGAKNKSYAFFDIPSLCKFEFGSDGQTAWERSVVLGPRLDATSRVGGLLGPDAAEVLQWTDADLSLETVSKSEVNGSPCYLIRMGTQVEGLSANTACFDVETGYLVKMTALAREGEDRITVDSCLAIIVPTQAASRRLTMWKPALPDN